MTTAPSLFAIPDTTQSPEEEIFTTQVTLLTTTPFNADPTTSVNFGPQTTALSLLETEAPPLPPTEAIDLFDVQTTAGLDGLFDIATPAPTFPADLPDVATTAGLPFDFGATLSATEGIELPEITTDSMDLFTLPDIATEGLPVIATTAMVPLDFATTASTDPTTGLLSLSSTVW